ncbi:enoyl-CoA hydratase [Sphingomonas vulcanisoli]|uniref:3-hydroxyisobutyryl-CoA hydrolase n=1 Tax=Sphingomonas vulcanisoli TaxID=1658060 RepID=A0ABX0TRY2_9SPHN|nr:enoyl-CoA hydratase [Sphingomonas vulcanisoli]
MSDAPELIVSVEGGVGRLRLNRPKAIHALTLGMCDAMIEALLAWKDDPAITAVLLDHAEGRGFCAGGDIRVMAESAKGDGVHARAFWHREYRLNHLMFVYPRPIVAFMDGITMGGGVGISQPARYRVATERTVYAMPETGIGLFPDVGGGWYLSRMPGRTGQYLAVTGARIDGADAVALDVATHYIESDKLDAVKAAIVYAPANLERILADAAVMPPPGKLADARADVDRLFASDRLEDIHAALEADGSDWAAKQIAVMDTKSPQTMKVALRQLAEGAQHVDFADEMRMEYGLAVHILQRPDFVEGVRALIIDKDNAPRWNPPSIAETPDSLIDAIFQPLPASDAWTPLPETGA